MIGVIINNVKSRYNTFLTKIVKAQLIYYIYKKTLPVLSSSIYLYKQ